MFLFWKNVENYGKMAVFPGGYGRIGVSRCSNKFVQKYIHEQVYMTLQSYL